MAILANLADPTQVVRNNVATRTFVQAVQQGDGLAVLSDGGTNPPGALGDLGFLVSPDAAGPTLFLDATTSTGANAAPTIIMTPLGTGTSKISAAANELKIEGTSSVSSLLRTMKVGQTWDAINSLSPIFIPASAFITTASATQKVQVPVYTLPDAATTTVRTSYMVPAWATTGNMTLKVLFSIDTLNGGSPTAVTISVQTASTAVGSVFTAVTTTTGTETVPANEAANTLHSYSAITTFAPSATGNLLTIRVDRLGSDGGDTYGSSVSFVGVTLAPVVNL